MKTPPAAAPVIVWFRRDLRLVDHPALAAAARTGRPVIPVFILSAGERPPGGASRWWLHHSLSSLASRLSAAGTPLVLRSGDPAGILQGIAISTGAGQLFFNDSTEADARHAGDRVAASLESVVHIRRCAGDSLYQPGSVLSGAGAPYRVFTPFWRACLARPEPLRPEGSPSTLRAFGVDIPTDHLNDWRLRPSSPDWAHGLRERWRPGEDGALAALGEFIESRMAPYATARDRPDLAGTSCLSPHLHFGEIGPRQVWHAARSRISGDSRLAGGGDAYLRELGWREFSRHLLHFWPDLPTTAFQKGFDGFRWRHDPAALEAWQRGETGYPLVDAGMRELWRTGWMHNRVRMVVASFLVKHLLIHWRAGEAWFWDTLVDADLASNVTNWQWVAGCGADAAPYFRIFNPSRQGANFDPDGAYVKRWLPELARLPARFVHSPWMAPAAVLTSAGLRLGKDYPLPIIDHAAARTRAMATYSQMRRQVFVGGASAPIC